jgi:putative chitinase
MNEFAIDAPLRQAAFLAQICHESGGFYYVRELASGKAYEGRADLGNTQPGDGPRYKGRGLLQITGRENYELCGEGLALDLINNPDLLEDHPHSSRSAGWFWSEFKNLNRLADQGDINRITKRINGGYNGLTERVMYYDRAKHVLGLAA